MKARQIFKKAQKHFEKKQYSQAISTCKVAIETGSATADILNLWGKLLVLSGKTQQGFNALNQACQVENPKKQHFIDLVSQAISQSLYEQALQIIAQFEKDQPNDLKLISLKGQIYFQIGHMEDARNTFIKGLSIDPSDDELQIGYASVIYSQGELLEAEEILGKVLLKGTYKGTHAIVSYADILIKLKKYEKAYNFLDSIIKSNKYPFYSIWAVYILACISFDNDQDLLSRLSKISLSGGDKEKQNYLYALGGLYDKLEKYPEAFSSFRNANELTYRKSDLEKPLDVAKKYIETVSLQRFPGYYRSNCTEKKPIFVVGMPRSGTTLLERIIAQADGVIAGGELPFIAQDVGRLAQEKKLQHTYELYDALDQADLNRMAENYLHSIDSVDAQASYIVDKMPSNFAYAGLIALAFPEAKIFHIQRNPMNVGLSCFCKNFHSSLSFTNSLESIAHYYKYYALLTSHWQKVLGDQMVTIRYESLIENFNEETQRIYNALGFDWAKENVNAFYTNPQAVTTASYAQVSQPLYKTGLSKWLRYEQELQPLYEFYQAVGIDPLTGMLIE